MESCQTCLGGKIYVKNSNSATTCVVNKETGEIDVPDKILLST